MDNAALRKFIASIQGPEPTYTSQRGAYRLPGVSNAPQPTIGPAPQSLPMNALEKHAPGLYDAIKAARRVMRPAPGPNPLTAISRVLGLDGSFGMVEGPAHATASAVGRVAKALDGPLAGTRVVDDAGAPRRVFHATTKAFDSFDAARAGENTQHPSSALGHFFTDDPGVAELFVSEVNPSSWTRTGALQMGANLRPARLGLRNPKEMSHEEFGELAWDGNTFRDLEGWRQLRDQFVKEGHDGVVVRKGPWRMPPPGLEEFGANTYVVFDRSQIRSPWGSPENAVQFGLLGGLLAGGAAAESKKEQR